MLVKINKLILRNENISFRNEGLTILERKKRLVKIEGGGRRDPASSGR